MYISRTCLTELLHTRQHLAGRLPDAVFALPFRQSLDKQMRENKVVSRWYVSPASNIDMRRAYRTGSSCSASDSICRLPHLSISAQFEQQHLPRSVMQRGSRVAAPSPSCRAQTSYEPVFHSNHGAPAGTLHASKCTSCIDIVVISASSS